MSSAAIQEKAADLSARLGESAKSTIEEALAENDLNRWFYGKSLTFASEQDLSWIYELDGNDSYSLEDYLADGSVSAIKKSAEKNAKFAKELYVLLQKSTDEEGKIKAAFKRNRNEQSWTYVAMAIFPEGTSLARDPDCGDLQVTKENPGIIFLETGSACVDHACDVLYKDLREKGGVGFFKYMAPKDIYDAIGRTGTVEFMDAQTRETEDPTKYLLASFMGIFSNQKTFRIPPELLIHKL
jgi:hypothetical protein